MGGTNREGQDPFPVPLPFSGGQSGDILRLSGLQTRQFADSDRKSGNVAAGKQGSVAGSASMPVRPGTRGRVVVRSSSLGSRGWYLSSSVNAANVPDTPLPGR